MNADGLQKVFQSVTLNVWKFLNVQAFLYVEIP